jgi:glycosyltransferase involved in cell wall biosynthesis
MRVGLLLYGSLDTLSGGYRYDRELVQHLRAAGDEVDIISLPWRTYGQHLFDNFSRALLKRLRSGRWDVLLQDELNHPSLFWINRRWKRTDPPHCPTIAIVHHLRASEQHPAWRKVLYRWIEHLYLASVDGFVFNSQTTRTAVEALVGKARPSVVAYPAGNRFTAQLTEAEVLARAHQSGPLRLVFVGNVIPRKNLLLLLRAAGRLPKATWKLAVIGQLGVDAAYTRTIRQYLQRHDLNENVVLHGALSDQELAAELAQAQLLAVPSEYEGFGIVYLEGMGFGLPAIASTAGAAHEIITSSVTGFLVGPTEVETLAAHLHMLATQREQLAQMGLAALDRYRAHPTWDQSMARIREFLATGRTHDGPKP